MICMHRLPPRAWAHCLSSIALALLGATSIHAAPPGDDVLQDRIIDIPGSSTVVHIWDERGVDGQVDSYYAIDLDGDGVDHVRRTSYDLLIRNSTFDPADGQPAVAPELGAAEDVNLYVVQYVTQPLPDYVAIVEGLGGDVYRFIANHAQIVYLPADIVEDVRALDFVRWVGPYEPAYRLEPILLEGLMQGRLPTMRYNVEVIDPGAEQRAELAAAITAIGGKVDNANAGKALVEATLSDDELIAVARLDVVLFIDRWSPVGTDMDIAREIGGANFLQSVAGYDGDGVRGEIIDIGFNVNHGDFADHPLIQHTTVFNDSHGAATSGIVFGDGSGNPMGTGMLPEGQGVVAAWNEVTNRYDHTGELVQDPYFCVLQSASVGNTQVTNYSSISAESDRALFDFDIVHCQSQSNTGSQLSRPQAWAKNIISVGGIRHMDTLTVDDDCWGCGGSAASIGPAEDGRIKPDLCHFYDNIFTVTSGGATAYTTSFGGTSGATPIVAGHVGLFFDMWADGVFGNPVLPGTVFDNRSHMTTAKAMLINTATQYEFDSAGHDLTRTHQGWGFPSVQRMFELRDQMLIIDETHVLEMFQSAVYPVDVPAGEPEFRATMTYADPSGTTSSSQHRINDLTLKVTSPSGDIYWGNHGLLTGNFSTTGGGANTVDTVENVFVQNPETGTWTVEVIADEINEDGHVETPQLDADFALVVSGVVGADVPFIIQLLDPIPALVPPGESFDLTVRVIEGSEAVEPGGALLFHRASPDDDFVSTPMSDLGDSEYLATVPGFACGDEPQFYFSFTGDGGTTITSPQNAPDSSFTTEIGEIVVTFEDNMELDLGWTTEATATAGLWERGVPVGGGDRGDPPTDADGSGQCYLTGNTDGDSDVDNGTVTLISPTLDGSTPGAVLNYYRWFHNSFGGSPFEDIMLVEISNNDGASWIELETVGPDGGEVSGGWFLKSFLIADVITPTDQIRLRFTVGDLGAGSVVEAGVDGVSISFFQCEGGPLGDLDGDGIVGAADLAILLGGWGVCPVPPAECPADLDGDGTVGPADLAILLGNWG